MPELPTSKRGAATSRRILDAAAAEFARHGIAGARVDRITAAAKTNKAQLYAYFGSKEGLFEAVIADHVTSTTDAIPFDVKDIAEWAVQVYDEHLTRPDLTRLISWIRLERRPTGRWFEGGDFSPKVDAMTAAQAAGRLREGDPVALLTLVISMASAWSATSGVYAASADEPEAEHESRRTLLRESVVRILAP
ncbi:TetR family transcriptional regulator [Gryllotalpicola reticulitermitis]|uniref:TetR family transcriptional regulator n=1 Tax=Gryllotalpicola reticulitermitis TaxID=1184153 RepID=A0ABV8Q218_9MICO